ncbi:group II intron-encoded protein LtrA [Clostridium homopropionicum DSM 5847]|uniref:RNA-directed DNA polymerase n=1 Tax=Clostridium homopropionicum DSM 5847 TaxID=1121318 RepID=A0A0L6ZEH6_9CLOT|nr:group II intron reverse transcriptase/maturase [Clostridium homopropionicum]KOA21352.1 group II intron-encoded protein LtrA [Clostridium homopropionicum DSM 5847]SFF83965.1 group II intron reverse transcriptase/maturase [Clostridium homopropionicum]SFG24768.1 group II intron reverse transcriptase/maturase [Clostridium homopropionicum]
MQKAEVVLSILKENSRKDEAYVFDRLYRNLFNEDFFLNAYREVYAKEGNMTKGTDGNTIDGFGYNLIEELIEKLKSETYYPNPVRRTYIPKKKGGKRPLGIPSFQDKLVQEVVKQIIESIYEPIFSDTSHGFRPKRSCHTALYQIKERCKGVNWFIEGDIKGFFDNMNQEILIGILKKKIKDGRLIELINRFLKAGYLEFNEVQESLTGTPQGGIISPILSNIYLHELDKFMESLQKEYNTKCEKNRNPEYHRTRTLRDYHKKKGNIDRAKELAAKLRKIPAQDPFDKEFKRVIYVRYADDFIVGISGNKKFAEEIRDRIKLFLQDNLKLQLSMEKTLITHTVKERAKFLGYEINKAINNDKLVKNTRGFKTRAVNGKIQLLVPQEVVNNKIKPFRKNNKPHQRNDRVYLDVKEIISKYNDEIRGLYNYYCLATDVSTKLYKFKYYHYYSMVRTIAKKERISIKKVVAKYGIEVPRKEGTGTTRVVGIRYNNSSGMKLMTYFNDSLTKVRKPLTIVDDTIKVKGEEIIKRLNSNTCELCGFKSNNRNDFGVHHVRKLKEVLEKYKKPSIIPPMWVLVMQGIRRKTLVVCKECHKEIHKIE